MVVMVSFEEASIVCSLQWQCPPPAEAMQTARPLVHFWYFIVTEAGKTYDKWMREKAMLHRVCDHNKSLPPIKDNMQYPHSCRSWIWRQWRWCVDSTVSSRSSGPFHPQLAIGHLLWIISLLEPEMETDGWKWGCAFLCGDLIICWISHLASNSRGGEWPLKEALLPKSSLSRGQEWYCLCIFVLNFPFRSHV